MRVVTISATYGTAGNHIGPAVAERLGVPFVDRAIPSAVAEELGCTLEEALAHDDRGQHGLGRLLSGAMRRAAATYDGRAEHGLGRLLSGAMRLPTVTFGGVDMYVPGAMPIAQEEFVRR